jgi:hypothetical protein
MKTKRSQSGKIVALAIGLSLLNSVARFAWTECYPCNQCTGGKCCFIETPTGTTGSICTSCCSGTV